MLTKDDLEQIAKVIDARIYAKLEPLIDVKLDPIKKALGRIERKLEEEVTDLAENIQKIMIHLDDHENRIRQLEQDSEFPRSH